MPVDVEVTGRQIMPTAELARAGKSDVLVTYRVSGPAGGLFYVVIPAEQLLGIGGVLMEKVEYDAIAAAEARRTVKGGRKFTIP